MHDMEHPSTARPEPDLERRAAPEFLDLHFIHRVYRTSAILVLILGLLLWESLGAPTALGLLIGAAVSLMMLAALEWAIRRFITPETRSPGTLLAVSALKLAAAAGILIGAFLAAQRGWVSILWILVGFAIPHLVIVLKLVGQKVNEAIRPPQLPRRN